MSNKKTCVLIGGGKSVRNGVETGLWDKIKGKDIWSLNYSYKLMPYLPNKQCFVDFQFFRHNEDDLQNLAIKGVPIHCKKNSHLNHIDKSFITQYNTVREQGGFRGKTALIAPPEEHLFIGRMGLVGIFSLSLAIAEGYNEVFLLGYDFGSSGLEDKDTHWYQNEINVKSTGVGRPTVYWNSTGLKKEVDDFSIFNTINDVEYYNVSPDSNIQNFKKINYEEFYKLI